MLLKIIRHNYSNLRPRLVKNLVTVIYFFETKMHDAVIINY